MNPTKEQMYQWYVVERLSYRQIMTLTGIKNNRKIPKLLKEYGIEIRRGSEAVKTQWENNDERRKKVAEIFSSHHRNKPSRRRISDSDIDKRLREMNVKLLERVVVDGYSWMECGCLVCGNIYKTNLKNMYGCPSCGREKGIEAQRLSFEEVEQIFNNNDMILLDTDYKNTQTPMAFICVNHAAEGVQYRSLNGVKKSGKCKLCNIEEKRKNSKGRERDKYSYHNRRWREAVFARDKYTCQCCGDNKGGNLQAHHIKNFLTHEHLRFDIDNGITLCQSCHDPKIKGSFHHTYGTYNNTEEQLKQYIENKQKQLSIL